MRKITVVDKNKNKFFKYLQDNEADIFIEHGLMDEKWGRPEQVEIINDDAPDIPYHKPIDVKLNISSQEVRWETLTTWKFPGTLELGDTPTNIDLIYRVDKTDLNGSFRILDGKLVVAEFSGLTSKEWTTKNTSALNNLTMEPALWQIQIRTKAQLETLPKKPSHKELKFIGYALQISLITIKFN